MNREDIDFDKLFDEDMPFKPLTDGLGFHHEPQQKNEKSLNTLQSRQKSLEQSLNARAGKIKRESKTQPAQRTMGDLAPFYNEKKTEPVELNMGHSAETPEQLEASSVSRLAAFFLDEAIILSSLAFILMTAALNSGLSLGAIGERLSLSFTAANLLPLLGLFYLFYFSFFDKTKFSTPGKRMMGIRVESLEEGPMTMGQSFSRALVLAMSLGSFGLIDLHSKLSNTKVIKR